MNSEITRSDINKACYIRAEKSLISNSILKNVTIQRPVSTIVEECKFRDVQVVANVPQVEFRKCDIIQFVLYCDHSIHMENCRIYGRMDASGDAKYKCTTFIISRPETAMLLSDQAYELNLSNSPMLMTDDEIVRLLRGESTGIDHFDNLDAAYENSVNAMKSKIVKLGLTRTEFELGYKEVNVYYRVCDQLDNLGNTIVEAFMSKEDIKYEGAMITQASTSFLIQDLSKALDTVYKTTLSNWPDKWINAMRKGEDYALKAFVKQIVYDFIEEIRNKVKHGTF